MIKPIYKQTFNPVPSPQSPVPCYTTVTLEEQLKGRLASISKCATKPELLAKFTPAKNPGRYARLKNCCHRSG